MRSVDTVRHRSLLSVPVPGFVSILKAGERAREKERDRERAREKQK